MTARRWLLVALAATAVLLLAGRALAQLYVGWAWYSSMGAAEVWRARTAASLTLHAISGAAATLFVFVNLYVVRKSVVSLVLPRRVANLEMGVEVSDHYLMGVVVVMSLVLGALLTIPQEDWSSFVLARAGRPFGETDPYFGLDLGFFVYWLPFERSVFTWTLISIFIVSAIVLFLYALTPSLRWERGTLYVSAYVRRHLTVLAGVLLLMLAWSYRLDMYGHLTNGSGPDGMFAYVDQRVGIPGSLVLAVVTFGAALIVVWGGWTGQLRLAFSAVLGVVVLSVIVREAAPYAADHFGDDGDPATRERPYEAMHAGFTRRAFALDRITTADSTSAYNTLAAASRGISLWDAPAVLRAIRRTPGGELVVPELAWHGTPAGIVVDAPERPERSDTSRQSWAVARLLVSTVDDRGAAIPVSQNGAPSTIPGQLQPPIVLDTGADYLIVADTLNRITGSSLESSLSRLAHAWSFQQPQILFDELPRPRPTVVTHRGVRDRLRELVPFFAQGSAVTPIILGDSLLWEVDLYSASSSYPLSRRTLVAGDVRTYFQHAATAVIAGTSGETWIVPDSVLDPIAATWVHRFPALFTNWASLPPGLPDRLPPAVDEVEAQAIAFGRFGTRAGTDAERRPPILDGADSALADAGSLPFIFDGVHTAVSVPLVDDAGERVRGVVLGLGGRIRRTQWYPLMLPGDRWTDVIDRLRGMDTATSQKEPAYRGAVHAYPVGGSLAYVQSTYAWHSDGPPTVARVRLLWADSVRTGSTLMQLAGTIPPALPAPAPLGPADFRARVEAVYRAMRDAMRRGDFAAFGRAVDELGRLVGTRTP